MEYESDNLKIIEDGIPADIDAQITRIREKIGHVFNEEKVSTSVALSIIATLYVNVAKGMMEMPEEVAIEAMVQTIKMAYYDEDEDRGEIKWLN